MKPEIITAVWVDIDCGGQSAGCDGLHYYVPTDEYPDYPRLADWIDSALDGDPIPADILENARQFVSLPEATIESISVRGGYGYKSDDGWEVFEQEHDAESARDQFAADEDYHDSLHTGE